MPIVEKGAPLGVSNSALVGQPGVAALNGAQGASGVAADALHTHPSRWTGTVGTTVTPANNGEFVIEETSNTVLTFKMKGSDGTVRSATLTLA